LTMASAKVTPLPVQAFTNTLAAQLKAHPDIEDPRQHLQPAREATRARPRKDPASSVQRDHLICGSFRALPPTSCGRHRRRNSLGAFSPNTERNAPG
jgi:hypothetical protein